ncbi:low-density lipoprotein receptor-related protein 4-like [Oscarella lobularis]|uniref:low-density lipoprotein receptor-related protein 4-like n=1 Tax=Oscarella lobularis TaxID=121494 RepID=UPI0033131ADD
MSLKRSVATLCLLAVHVLSVRSARSSPTTATNATAENVTATPTTATNVTTENVTATNFTAGNVSATTNSSCAFGFFQCRNDAKCIPRRSVCDQVYDCGDNSDERGCPTTQLPTTPPCRLGSDFLCDDGRCIDYSRVCDGQNDCGDDSDERNCNCDTHTWSYEWSYECGDGSCIFDYQYCDGHADCDNDEDYCQLSRGSRRDREIIIIIAATCSVLGIVVIVGASVSLYVQLKRRAALPQQSCLTDTAPPPAYGPGGAMNPAFAMTPLPGAITMVSILALCLLLSTQAQGYSRSCSSSYEFRCGNGRCIYKSYRCDGDRDCDNDEDGCPLSGGGVAILAVTFTIIGIVAFVGALVALCIKSKNRRVESQHQSWPTENALPPGAMIQVPAYFMPPPPGPPPGPPPSGFQEQPPSFDEAVSEKRQS